jgi:hypothetical protein
MSCNTLLVRIYEENLSGLTSTMLHDVWLKQAKWLLPFLKMVMVVETSLT